MALTNLAGVYVDLDEIIALDGFADAEVRMLLRGGGEVLADGTALLGNGKTVWEYLTTEALIIDQKANEAPSS